MMRRTEGYVRVQKDCGPVSRTHQSMAGDADINTIVGRYRTSGILPDQKVPELQYGDFTLALDLHDSMIAVQAAQDDFMELNSKIREACDNDPVKFLDMCADPERIEELRELGLLEEQKPETAQPTPPTVPPATAQGEAKEAQQDSQTAKA